MKHLILIPALILMLASCSPASNEALVAEAEAQLAAGQIENARINCAALADSAMNLTPSQLCRVAIVCSRLADKGDELDDMALAAECYNRAIAISPDSVAAFLGTLDVESMKQLVLLRDVSMAMNEPCDYQHYETEEFSDSIFAQ